MMGIEPTVVGVASFACGMIYYVCHIFLKPKVKSEKTKSALRGV
jgi:hypothetical protein